MSRVRMESSSWSGWGAGPILISIVISDVRAGGRSGRGNGAPFHYNRLLVAAINPPCSYENQPERE